MRVCVCVRVCTHSRGNGNKVSVACTGSRVTAGAKYKTQHSAAAGVNRIENEDKVSKPVKKQNIAEKEKDVEVDLRVKLNSWVVAAVVRPIESCLKTKTATCKCTQVERLKLALGQNGPRP